MRGDKPTPKQRMFAKAYIKNKFNGGKSALEIYNTTPKQAHNIAHQNLNKPVVQRTIQEELARQGITLEYANEMMKKAMDYNLEGKPSQSVLLEYIKHTHKLYNTMPSSNKVNIKQEYKVLLGKDYNILKQELTETLTRSQELLDDLRNEAK